MNTNQIIHGDCINELTKLRANSIDLICTDPPYGIGFMGKEWDTFKSAYIRDKKATKQYFASNADVAGKYSFAPDSAHRFGKFIEDVFRQALRVAKPGAFLFMTMTPRQDSLAYVVVGLERAGWKVSFSSLYWTFSSGFPKAMNVQKTIDRKSARRPTSTRAHALEGSYGGFQPKPAVEAIIVAMKPLSGKTFAGQALKNRKGITWLDDCRIPAETLPQGCPRGPSKAAGLPGAADTQLHARGRFPANLLVSDRTLGDYSRYFCLDGWSANLPFLISPKSSKRERNEHLSALPLRASELKHGSVGRLSSVRARRTACGANAAITRNHHPTVKPLALMSYLVTLGSRPGDVVLDPFLGSGTTALAAKLLGRHYVGIEREKEYVAIARARTAAAK